MAATSSDIENPATFVLKFLASVSVGSLLLVSLYVGDSSVSGLAAVGGDAAVSLGKLSLTAIALVATFYAGRLFYYSGPDEQVRFATGMLIFLGVVVGVGIETLGVNVLSNLAVSLESDTLAELAAIIESSSFGVGAVVYTSTMAMGLYFEGRSTVSD